MIDLQIDNLTFGGRGVGRLDGKAIFVPYTIAGEKVRCRIVNEQKRYSEAELIEILEPSAYRQAPPCPVFAECGGCQWQHLPYAQQLQWKEQIFKESLSRSMQLDDDLFQPIVASPSAWNYRCRAQIKCRRSNGKFVAGFYRPGSHFVVDIESCPLLAPELNLVLPRLKEVFSTFLLAHQVPQLDLTVDANGQLSLIVHFLERDHSPLTELLTPFAAEYNCSIHVQQGHKTSPVELISAAQQFIQPLVDHSLQLQFPPGGFVQVNLAQNQQLVADVVSHVAPGQKILDLYCGIGNFSLPLAQSAESVVGVEGFAPAINAARNNAQACAMNNTSFVVSEAGKGLRQQSAEGEFDVIVLDPPRAGADGVIRQLPNLKPQQIIYVSCDPMTLARDLKYLLANGYRPVSIRPYDMFPQTYHIEGLVVLVRDV